MVRLAEMIALSTEEKIIWHVASESARQAKSSHRKRDVGRAIISEFLILAGILPRGNDGLATNLDQLLRLVPGALRAFADREQMQEVFDARTDDGKRLVDRKNWPSEYCLGLQKRRGDRLVLYDERLLSREAEIALGINLFPTMKAWEAGPVDPSA